MIKTHRLNRKHFRYKQSFYRAVEPEKANAGRLEKVNQAMKEKLLKFMKIFKVFLTLIRLQYQNLLWRKNKHQSKNHTSARSHQK